MALAQRNIFAGDGEMAALTRSRDWGATPLGPVADWPPALLTAVNLILESRYPMLVLWGPDLVQFYNDAFRPILGSSKHPRALGAEGRDTWSEIWEVIGPLFRRVRDTGKAVWYDDLLLEIDRNGYLEETHFAFSYSPIRDEDGGVGGVLVTCTETTAQVVSERRLRTLRELAARTVTDRAADACAIAAAVLADNRADVLFALIYLLDANGGRARVAGAAGVPIGTPLSPTVVEFGEPNGAEPVRPLQHVVETGEAIEIAELAERFGELPGGLWPESPHRAVVAPLRQADRQSIGLLVAGVSPRLALDDAYRGFLDLVADQVATAIVNAQTLEGERQRAEALAALDRAKTAFFSNVSHEFRTPLTLLLGPLEALLNRSQLELSDDDRREVEVAHRNGLRLLRLVNTLLDFSRIEAGRIEASYEPTDLATLTADLASLFRAAVERAGLRFVVDCPPLPEPVFVDRQMWEKIVLNLLSNALKHTFAGEIAVRLRTNAGRAELTVHDTGVGIPAGELPRIFERFYRAPATEARTHEGSGIGLSLVDDLVRLHGGAVGVESEEGGGSAFTVVVPFGAAHLPADRIGAPRTLASTALGAAPFIEEALRWLPDAEADGPIAALPEAESTAKRERILVIDDNADMRDYLRRLLEPRWQVEAAADGEAGLAAMRANPPDLVLTDVMMPRLDGFGMLRAVRTDPALRDVPVVLVSARAGEAATVEGLAAGADDYLAKPFTARELRARIAANLKMARIRKEANENAERSRLAIAVTGLGTWRYDPATDLVSIDERMAQIWGEPGATTLPLDVVLARIHPEDRERAASALAAALAPESSGRSAIEHRAVWPDGTVRWVATTGQVRFAGVGAARRPIEFFGTALDVTDRHRTEDELRRRAALLDQADEAIFAWTWDGAIAYWNKGAERLYGYTAEEAIGQISHVLLRTAHPGGRDEFLRRLEQEGIVAAEVRQTRRDGATVVVATRHQLIRDGDRRIVLEANRDITERARAEQALRESEARLALELADARQLQRISSQLIQEDDIDLLYDQILDAAITVMRSDCGSMQMLFPERNELLLLTEKGLAPESAAFWQWVRVDSSSTCGSALAAGERVIVPDVERCAFMAGTDDLHYYRLSGIRAVQSTPLVSRDGRIVGMISTHWRDVHQPAERELRLLDVLARQAADLIERRRAEMTVRQSERRLQQLADAMPQIVWISSADGATITYVNERWLAYVGEAADGRNGWPSDALAAAIHPDDRQHSAQRWQAALASGAIFEDEVRMRGADGRYRWFLSRCLPVRDVAGTIAQWFGTSTDITALKQAEEALRGSEERLQRAIDIETVGVIYFRTDGAITYANDAFLQMSGYDRDDLARGLLRWDTMTPPEWMPPTLQAMASLVETGRIAPYEKEYIRKDGSRWWTLCAGTRLSDDEGVKFVLDLTETRQMEAAHAAVLDAIAHDVKNPLTTIVGQAQMIGRDLSRETIDLERVQHRAAAIDAGARRATELLDDLTDAARLRAGQPLTLQPAPVDLVPLVEAAAAAQQSATDRHTIAVETAVASLVGVWDGARIRRVLDNLLGNAVKYSPDGGPVTIRVRRLEGPHGSWAEAAVADRGVGIPAGDLPHVFEPFHRGRNVARQIVGSGIGLSGARQIVEQHGGAIGAIGATSVEGEGSVFTLRLPIAPDEG